MKHNERKESTRPLAPALYLVATPIGNLRDITLRAIDTLKQVDTIYCEDTRVTAKLLNAHDISTPTKPYHDHNAAKQRPHIMSAIASGKAIALVSDAGTPLISDPGFKLVELIRQKELPVITIPGPSAALAALTCSALPTDRFFFYGFLPPKTVARTKELTTLTTIPATLIFYESAKRLKATLTDLHKTLGPRITCIARELTKKFEEVRTAPLTELITHYETHGNPKGEIVILVGPPDTNQPPADLDTTLKAALERLSLKDAVTEVSTMLNLPKKHVYARALELSDE